MPVFEITSPEGKTYQVTGPEGSTQEQALAQLQQQLGASSPRTEPAAPEGKSLAGFAKNIGPSALEAGKAMIHPFMHPLETANTIFRDLPLGAAEKIGMIDQGGQYSGKLDQIGQFFKDRYGGVENIKNTIYQDPVGAAMDASAVLTGPAQIPGRVGKIAATASRVVDPLSVPIMALKGAGQLGAEVIGGLGTHTGAESLRTAARSGAEGGAAGQAFRDNMRDVAPMAETVQIARDAVDHIRRERGAAYRAGMVPVAADKTVLSFGDLYNAVNGVSSVKNYKGQSLSPTTEKIRQTMTDAVMDWNRLDPAEFHTAEGFDALKQKLGDIRDATERGTPERVVADQIYQAARKEIIKQVPEYAKVMKGYEEATKQIKDIEKTLSLNPNASVDTALRKLQSVLRDNVNTSFGRRKELAQYLVDAGAPHLMERLAGQALKPWTPRGLAKMVGTELVAAGAGAFGAGMSGAGGAALGALPFMSPRIMGEAAHLAGRASNIPGRAIGQTSFQAGRLAEKLDPREMVKNDAKEAMNDKSFSPSQRENMRAVAEGKASIETVMAVKNLLERKFKFEDGGGARGYQGIQ